MKLDSIERKLSAYLDKYFKSEGYAESELDSLYTIKFEQNVLKKYVDLYLYAGISVDDFFTISDNLNEIVESADPSSYFDILSPEIYSARLYWDAIEFNESEESKNILSKKNLIKFGEAITSLLNDEYDEDFWVDNISFNAKRQYLNIEVSSTNYKSKCSVRIYEYDLDSYKDLIDIYQSKVFKSLKLHVVEL